MAAMAALVELVLPQAPALAVTVTVEAVDSADPVGKPVLLN
jgi:hypothetical protein